MSINSHLPAASRTATSLSSEAAAPAMASPRVKRWSHATANRARPFALALALFATAFTATIVLRLILALAYLTIHSAL
jgi:hypothetical protein